MGFWADCTLTCMACVCIPVHLICTVSDCDPAVEMVCDLLEIDARISTYLAVNHPQSRAKKKFVSRNASSNNLPLTVG
jgi:hypothetical protein